MNIEDPNSAIFEVIRNAIPTLPIAEVSSTSKYEMLMGEKQVRHLPFNMR